jgi:hypothetical protein
MHAPWIYEFSQPTPTRPNTCEVTAGLSRHGRAQLRAALLAIRLAHVLLAPFGISIGLSTR